MEATSSGGAKPCQEIAIGRWAAPPMIGFVSNMCWSRIPPGRGSERRAVLHRDHPTTSPGVTFFAVRDRDDSRGNSLNEMSVADSQSDWMRLQPVPHNRETGLRGVGLQVRIAFVLFNWLEQVFDQCFNRFASMISHGFLMHVR